MTTSIASTLTKRSRPMRSWMQNTIPSFAVTSGPFTTNAKQHVGTSISVELSVYSTAPTGSHTKAARQAKLFAIVVERSLIASFIQKSCYSVGESRPLLSMTK